MATQKSRSHISVPEALFPLRDLQGRDIGPHSISPDETDGSSVRTSGRYFRVAANAEPVIIWAAGLRDLRTYINKRWADFTGRSVDTKLGNRWLEGVHPDDDRRCRDTYSCAFNRREGFRMEYRLRRHNGEYRWILDAGVPVFDRHGSFVGYVGAAIDINDLKLAQEALRGVGARLIQVQEEERSRIARDLHDDINQRLGLLAMAIDRLRHRPPNSGNEVANRLRSLLQQTYDISRDIQSLSHQLHSSKLQELGLVVGMQTFCAEFATQHQVEIEFVSGDLPYDIPRDVTLCLFRVLQEALQNAVKHSGVRHFQVHLDGTPRQVHLAIRDSGIGFAAEKAMKGPGLGLTSMRERMRLVKGRLVIKSGPRQGTLVRAEVPLTPRCNAEEGKEHAA